jgi:hypothetical protein
MNGPLVLDPDDEDDPALALLKDLSGKQLIFYKEYGSAVRIYVDEDALWLTVNAEWSNASSRWEKGTIGVGSLALFMSAENFRILWESGNSSDWDEFDWDRGVELGGLTYTTNFVEWRDFSEWGLYTIVPIYVRTYTANSAENVGGAFSYPIRFSSPPSSVTIVTSFKSPSSWAVEPTVLSSMNSERGGAWYGRPNTSSTGYVELGAEVYAQ